MQDMAPFSAFLRTQELGCTNRTSSPLYTMFRRDTSNATNFKASLMLGLHPWTRFLWHFLTWKKENELCFGKITIYCMSSLPEMLWGCQLVFLSTGKRACSKSMLGEDSEQLGSFSSRLFSSYLPKVQYRAFFSNVLLSWHHKLKTSCSGLVQWRAPAGPVTLGVEAGALIKPRSSRPAWDAYRDPVSKTKYFFAW